MRIGRSPRAAPRAGWRVALLARLRAWRADAGLLALAALLGWLFLLDSRQASGGRGDPFPWLDLTAGAVACLTLLLRRRWPVGLALALIPAMTVSASTMGATAVAVAAVARARPWRVTAVVLAVHAAVVTSLFALVASSTAEFWQGLVVLLALDAALVSSGLLIRSQRLLVDSLRDRAREAEERQRLRIEQARHAERERLAREMHDVLAHRLSLLAVHAGALEVRRSAPEDERQAAAVIRQCAYQALEDLRDVLGMLRDDGGGEGGDRPQPTLADVADLVAQSRQTGTAVTFDDRLDGSPDPDGAGPGRHVYRIVQEGLTNARKHAPGAPVRVTLAGGDGDVTVEITNPPPPARTSTTRPGPPPGAGRGLIGLRERMAMIGGRFEHGHTPEGGFRLYARLPWRP